jgi:uncharacterized protein (TIGR01777 family)
MDTVMITGGTGLVGTALGRALINEGFAVIILTRKPQKSTQPGISYATWDVNAKKLDEDALRRTDYIVHLAGANVGEGRWTEKRKKEIIGSRVESGNLLMQKLREVPNKVRAVISASATGYYGPDPQLPNPRPFVETDRPDTDFLASVVVKWEAALQPLPGKRLVFLRTGIALSPEGGAFAELKKTLPFGIASILGNGRQMVSWIHIGDLVRLYIESIRNEKMTGVYNAVAPQPASNKKIILQIAKERGKPYVPVHVPAFVLKAMLGEMSVEVLKSTTVSSAKLEREGFRFFFPGIEAAVKDLLFNHRGTETQR